MVYKIRNKGFDIFSNLAAHPRVAPLKNIKVDTDTSQYLLFQS